MLKVEGVSHRYSGNPVLRDVGFDLRPGEIVAYLGANGAGKTTTVKVLTGLLQPRRGRVLYRGRDIADDLVAYHRRLAYVPEEPEVYPFLSAHEYLMLVGGLRGLPDAALRLRIEELLDTFGLASQQHQHLSSYSRGMRQKVLISAALLDDADVLILDEPLSGLDVGTVMVMKALLRGLAARGRTILYSTHVLEVAESLCRRVLILHQGRIVADDSIERLRQVCRQSSLEGVFSACVGATGAEESAARILETMAGDEASPA